MNKRLLPFALVLAAAAAAAASAESPASVHGVVYACATRTAIAGAYVALRGLDDGSVIHLRSDARGRFQRVGLTPGRWLIQAGQSTDDARFASTREAVLESDDSLSMVIGVRTTPRMISHVVSPSAATPAPGVNHTDCDPYRVPAAPSTSDRYIIH